MYRAAVLTISDKASKGEREDTGGPLVARMISELGINVAFTRTIPDEKELIEEGLSYFTDEEDVALIMTTGGTGLAERDVTPEATAAVCDRLVPGIPEAMRYEGLKVTSRAMLSRMEAGIRGKTLIVNLPGSPKAIKENLQAVLPALEHGLEMLRGKPRDCAEDKR